MNYIALGNDHFFFLSTQSISFDIYEIMVQVNWVNEKR